MNVLAISLLLFLVTLTTIDPVIQPQLGADRAAIEAWLRTLPRTGDTTIKLVTDHELAVDSILVEGYPTKASIFFDSLGKCERMLFMCNGFDSAQFHRRYDNAHDAEENRFSRRADDVHGIIMKRAGYTELIVYRFSKQRLLFEYVHNGAEGTILYKGERR